MQSKEQNGGMCRSVFKNTSPAEIGKAYNQQWIEMINRLERQKQLTVTRNAEQAARG